MEFVSQYLSGLLAILGFAIEHAVCEERAPYGAYLKLLALQVDSDFWNLSFQLHSSSDQIDFDSSTPHWQLVAVSVVSHRPSRHHPRRCTRSHHPRNHRNNRPAPAQSCALPGLR